MDKEKAIAVLRFYRDIDKSVRLNERVIKDLEDQYYDTTGAVNMDGMPHGKGKTSSSVERTALNIPGSVMRTIREMERENEKLEKIKTEILHELNCLNFHQKEVVWDFYISGQQWGQISEQTHYSQRQCRNIRDEALDRLKRWFSRNRTIANYHFPD